MVVVFFFCTSITTITSAATSWSYGGGGVSGVSSFNTTTTTASATSYLPKPSHQNVFCSTFLNPQERHFTSHHSVRRSHWHFYGRWLEEHPKAGICFGVGNAGRAESLWRWDATLPTRRVAGNLRHTLGILKAHSGLRTPSPRSRSVSFLSTNMSAMGKRALLMARTSLAFNSRE